MRVECYAKINLFLDILNRRKDGYHNIKTVMQAVSLCDYLTVEKDVMGGGTRGVTGGVTGITFSGIEAPKRQDDIVCKAAELFYRVTGFGGGVRIHIDKHIPVGAGLGGGSSDAAGVLMSLNELYGGSLSWAQLLDMARSIGSDVPFFLRGGCALAEGIGDILTPIEHNLEVFCVILKPSISILTKWAYENVSFSTSSVGVQRVLAGLLDSDLSRVASGAFNVFEDLVFTEYPKVCEYKNMLINMGAELILMSGSGSAIFGIFSKEETAKLAYENLNKCGCCFFCKFIKGWGDNG